MAKRYTVSVPDDLDELIEEYREDLGSPSGIFQWAIRREIEKIKNHRYRLKSGLSMQDIFQKGDFKTPETQFAVGKELGFAYAKTAPYPEIKRFEEFKEYWIDQDEFAEYHFHLNILVILAREIGVEKSAMGPGGVPKYAIRLTSSFDMGFMEGVIDFIKGQFTPVEIRKLSSHKDRRLYVVKDISRQTKIIEDTSIVAKVSGENPWEDEVEDPFADY